MEGPITGPERLFGAFTAALFSEADTYPSFLFLYLPGLETEVILASREELGTCRQGGACSRRFHRQF